MSNPYATKGHRVDAPGLRGHSTGDEYPLTVVGVGYPIRWQVENLLTGEVLSEPGSCAEAHAAMRRLAGRA